MCQFEQLSSNPQDVNEIRLNQLYGHKTFATSTMTTMIRIVRDPSTGEEYQVETGSSTMMTTTNNFQTIPVQTSKHDNADTTTASAKKNIDDGPIMTIRDPSTGEIFQCPRRYVGSC
jgi:hypothetical protein